MKCNCCKEGVASLVRGYQAYPDNPHVRGKLFWMCSECGALVGCHPGTDVALGTLANKQTRQARADAHDIFDRLWKGNIMESRDAAYQWLAETLEIPIEECHIGSFDFYTCTRVEDVVNRFFDKRR